MKQDKIIIGLIEKNKTVDNQYAYSGYIRLNTTIRAFCEESDALVDSLL